MTTMPMANARPTGLPGLGEMLARLAAGQQPGIMPMPMLAQPNGPGGAALLGAIQLQPLPAPVPREQSATPGAGGIAPGPRLGDALTQPGIVPPMPARSGPSKGQIIAGILGDTLAGLAGRPAVVAPMWARNRELDDQRAYEEARWHRDRNARRQDEMRPRVEQVGDALGTYDPVSKTFEPIYTQPQPFEAYARAQGFQPGTEEYARAVEDYRLGSWSDPAVENRAEVEGVKVEGRSALETVRAANRLRETRERLSVTRRGQDIRSGDTRRGQDFRSGDTRRGQDLRDATTRRGQDLRSQLRGRRVGGQPVADNEPIARAADGTPLVVRNGKWVPAK